MFSIKKKKKGLTLIETLISFLILTFVLTPMLMVINSSVKTNKSGEDKQKTLYIAQKYAENFKRKDIDKNKLGQVQKFKNKDVLLEYIDADIPNGYFVNVIVEDLPQYRFSVATSTATSTASASTGTAGNTSSTTNSNGYNSIQYDAKVKIIKDTNKTGIVAHIEVEDKDTNKGTYDLNNNYKLEISNGKENASNGVDNILLITLKDDTDKVVAGSPWTINKNPDTNKNANIIVQVDSNEQTTSKVNLYIDCYNKISEGNMSIYSTNSKDTTLSSDFNKDVVNCQIENKQGKVNVYSNIYNNTTNTYSDTDTRVYKITVRLFKDDEDKPINQVITYKTVQQ